MSKIFGRKIEPEDSPLLRADGRKTEAPSPPPVIETPVKRSSSEPDAEESSKTHKFVARAPLYQFGQVVLPAHVLGQFKTLLSRIRNHKLLYEEWGLKHIDPQGKHVAFNLYGPPGTGKTMCAEALAAELGTTIIDVSYAELESKFVGETGKNIVEVFNCARSHNALLFFDEADSILGKRMTSVTQGADHGVNVARAVMLKQLDAFDGVVGFATNLARNYDTAFVRRILMHIDIPLPDAEGRRILWGKFVPAQVPGAAGLDWEKLSTESDGLAGGDMKNALVAALAAVADRTEIQRVLKTEDLLAALRAVSRAKSEVGSPFPKISEEILPSINSVIL